MFGSVRQCVAVCCSLLQCVAVCYSVLQCIAVCCSVLQCATVGCSVLHYVAAVSAGAMARVLLTGHDCVPDMKVFLCV